jgi:hypothetical protein
MKRLWNFLAGMLLVVTVVSAASADITPYYNEGTFASPSVIQPGYYREEFTDITYDPSQGPSLAFASTSGFAYEMSADAGVASTDPSLVSLAGSMSTNNATDLLKINFTGSSVTAVGGNFWPTDFDGNNIVGDIIITLTYGTNEFVTSVENANSNTFSGFVIYGDQFTSMTIRTIYTGDDIFPTVDNFYVGQQVVPVPSAVLLGIIGLGYAGRRLRRRTA